MNLNPISLLSPARQPYMARANYRHELVTSTTLPVAVAMVEGGVIAVLSKTVFHVSDLVFATIFAAPMFANLTSGTWAWLIKGRRKAGFTAMLMLALMVVIASIAFLPVSWAGGLMLVAMVVLARCLVTGIVAARSLIWRTNFARATRATTTGKLIFIAAMAMTAAPPLGYRLLDSNPDMFRLVYPVAAGIGLIGALAFARVRVRREKQLLSYERGEAQASEAPPRPGGPALLQPNGKQHTMLSVLRYDRRYRYYMIWQFLAGMSMMTGNAAAVRFITDVFEGHKYQNWLGVLYAESLVKFTMAVTLPIWASYLNRVHIAHYRSRHGLCWIASQGTMFVVAMTGWVGLLAIPRMLQGLAFGGGTIAWQLGHHDFADRRLATLYMGIHQTLTGVRGAVAPFLGVFLLVGWEQLAWGERVLLPAWAGIGDYVWLITTCLATISWLGYVALHRAIQADQRAEQAGAK